MSINRHARTGIFLDSFLDASKREKFYDAKIVISGDDTLNSPNGILMAKTLVNLTARFSNEICISLPDKFSKFEDELIFIAKATGAKSNSNIPESPQIVIAIGDSSIKGDFIIRINSDGWISHLTCNKSLNISKIRQNPIGAMGAACFGSAECFKRILENLNSNHRFVSQHPDNLVFSFLDYSLTDNNQEFPAKIIIHDKILLVGAGAVGSAVIYGFSQIPQIEGKISVVDNDVFDETNLNRCLLAFIDNLGKNKAEVASLCSSKNLVFESHPMIYEKLSKTNSEFPIILSTVDNNEVRQQIQSDLPRLIFHGATGNQIATISLIKFLENACFGCIFQPQTKSREQIISEEMGIPLNSVTASLKNNLIFSEKDLEHLKKKHGKRVKGFEKHIGRPFEEVFQKEVCAKLEIHTENGQKAASVSFVSFFSGLGIISEFIKYSSKIDNVPMMTNRDFYQSNMFKLGFIPGPNQRAKNSECFFCSNIDIQQIFSKKWGL